MNTSILYGIIMFVILITMIIVYYIYYYLPNTNNVNKYKITLLSTETEFNNEYENSMQFANLITTRNTLYIPKLGYGLTFSWEMFIPNLSSNDKWNNGFNILKPIITMNDSPQIAYHPKKNYLSIILKYRDNPFRAQYAEIKFDKIKQQKWSKYILVINGRTIQLYIDNILVSAQFLPSLPVIYDINSEIILGQKNNNFLGKVRNINIIPFPVSYNDISNI
jgi:hypothetical protein